MEALVWATGKQYVGPDNITKAHGIICIAWKWAGAKVTRCLTWDEQRCDRTMLEEFVAVMHSADEVVTHNGDRFDTPWIRTRCVLHGIPMSPDFVSIDTLKASRSKLRFPMGNRLDSIARFLDLGRKMPTGFELWKRVLGGDPAAKRKMVAYCKHDVALLEAVWERLMPYLPAKMNRALHRDECPECGSASVIVCKHRVTAQGYAKVQFQCKDCGKFHTVAKSRFNSGEVVA